MKRPSTQEPNISFSRKLSSPLDFADRVADSWRFLSQFLPTSLAVREIMRFRALAELGPLSTPLLDVGCGDGLFWENWIRNFNPSQQNILKDFVGVDINSTELKLASIRLSEKGGLVFNRDISATPDWSGPFKFNTVIANCSLEHVQNLNAALKNILNLMTANGQFILFVPAPYWTNTLKIKYWGNRISPRMGGLIGGCFDGFFQHHHLYSIEVWTYLLEGIGFKVIDTHSLGSKSSNHLFERNLATGFMAFLFKSLTGRYPWLLAEKAKKSKTLEKFLADLKEGKVIQKNLHHPDLVEYMIICHRK